MPKKKNMDSEWQYIPNSGGMVREGAGGKRLFWLKTACGTM
jgi:hypothetical protein